MTAPLKKRGGDKMSPTEQMVTKCYRLCGSGDNLSPVEKMGAR
jgi:hypothetical protein